MRFLADFFNRLTYAIFIAFAVMAANAQVRDPLIGTRAPWKVAVVLYDHPGASMISVADATLMQDDSLFVPITVTWRDSPEGFTFTRGYDWYQAKDILDLNLVSRDRGLSWEVFHGAMPEKSFHLKDGSRLRLKWSGYVQHPLAEQSRWEQAGYWLYMIPEKKMFATTGAFEVGTSRDGGKSWQSHEMKLPQRAFLAGYGMATAKMLSDGTIVMPAFGYLSRKHRTYACSIIRSHDGGRTWDLVTIAQDERPQATSATDIPSGKIWSDFSEATGFDEAQVVETKKAGRVIAIIEESLNKDLYSCFSDDYGKTWTKPKVTGMKGNTPLLLRLKSGALACAATIRKPDGGMRVYYSYDDGVTWDADHPVVLKDDNARSNGQCLWNFVQFSDETLFASGWATKSGCGGGPEVSYAIGFRFTEAFRTPLRVAPQRSR